MFKGKYKTGLINPNTGLILLPVISIVVMVVVFIIGAKIAYDQISKLRVEIADSNRKINQLNEKYETLRNIGDNILDSKDSAVLALPSENPAILVFSNIRGLIRDNKLSVQKLQLKQSVQKTNIIKSANIDMEMESNFASTSAFIKNLSQRSPITLTKKLEYMFTSDNIEAKADIEVYWSDLPTQIPKITEPVNTLDKKDNEVLEKIINFTKPEFIEVDPNGPFDRQDPFN